MDNYDSYILDRQDELEFLADLFGVDHSDYEDLTEDDLMNLYGHKVA